MQRRQRNIWNKDDKGFVVIEALYIVVITIFAIMLVLDFGVLYHNRIITMAAADEAAAGAGFTYNSAARDPFTGYVPPEFFTNRKIFRHLDNNLNVQTQKKAQWYGSYLVYKDEFSKEHDTNFAASVSAECSKNYNLGCQIVSVNIQREYKTFFINPLSIFGIDPAYTCKATGSAVCYDPIYQMNMIQMVNQMTTDAEKMGKIGKVLQESKGFFDSLYDLF